MTIPSIHADTVLGSFKIKVSNLARSIEFYREVVGFQVLSQDQSSARLTVDGIHAFAILEEIPSALITPRRTSSGLYHFAILVPTREHLGLSLRRLAESGIPVGQGDHSVSEALYISDPDNNGIEIYRDRPRSEWKHDAQGNILMGTDPVDIEGLLALAGNKPWTGLSPQTILGHIHLHVASLAESKAFYCDVLGFDLVVDGASMMGAYFVSAGGYHHHIGMNIWAGVGAPQAPANATGLAYFTIVLPNGSELERIVARLDDAGFPYSLQEGQYCVKDPSGIEVRLISVGA
ncbi:VOC family protein [Cohnella endophytica]|uniref:VOC family protein n=1 Tax=Cohnella endophytica TaxID=2419778 RepID=A0A494XQY9_9BACL|nr:VOC family protein [Cohnella endophytica]RKP53047.1 VOC family protein [Cohnella endophytica]